MADVYLALLGIEFTVAVFLAAGAAAVNQAIASAVSDRAVPLVWRARRLWLGFGLLIAATGWSLAAATLLRPHSADLSGLAGNPSVAFATGLAVAASVGFLALTLLNALQLLSPVTAIGRLVRPKVADDWAAYVVGSRAGTEISKTDRARAAEGLGLDPVVVLVGDRLGETLARSDTAGSGDQTAPTHEPVSVFTRRLSTRAEQRALTVGALERRVRERRLQDPLDGAHQIVARAVVQEAEDRFRTIFLAFLEETGPLIGHASCDAVAQSELRELLVKALFEEHLDPLSRAALGAGRTGHAAVISNMVALRAVQAPNYEMHAAAFRLVFDTARGFVEQRAASALCSAINDLAILAVAAKRIENPLREQAFNEVCRALGNLGQRIPTAFHPGSEPEVTIFPDAPTLQADWSLGALLDATRRIKDEVFESPPSVPSPLVWADAVKVTAREVARHASVTRQPSSMERLVYDAFEQLSDVARSGARAGDDHWTMIGGYALAELARTPRSADWHEYPSYLATRLAEIAIMALDRKINVHGLGDERLGAGLARALVRDLGDQVEAVELKVEEGRFDGASWEANEEFLELLRHPREAE